MAEERPVPPPLDAPEEDRSLERYYMVGLLCMLFLILAFPLYRIGEPDRRERAAEALLEENIALGSNLFARHCASCHGDAGSSSATGQALGSPEYLAEITDARLAWLTSGGVPGTAMAAFHMDLGGPLGDHEIRWIVTYLRSLEDRPEVAVALADEPVEPAEPAPVDEPLPPVEVAAVWRVHCAACHGLEAQGGAVGSALRPLPAHLQADPDSAFTVIARGIPGFMVPYLDERRGPLDARTIRAIVDWLREPDGD